MKFEEFKKYKMIAESQDTELLQQYPEAEKVYTWMEETGRLDEGFWSAIWSWLKRNLSPTSRKLHNLADEYEKELEAEYQAVYGKFKNSKDLDAKFRASFAGRIAEDIHDKMEIIAGDDEDYRELVKALINKKNLRVKKKLINELIGKMDPDEVAAGGWDDALTRTTQEEKEGDRRVTAAVNKVSKQNPETYKAGSDALQKKIQGNNPYMEMGYDSSEKVQKIVQKLLVYQNALSEKGEADFTVKAIEGTLKDFREFITAGAKKLESSKISYSDALKIMAEITEKRLMDNKPVKFSRMQSEVFKEAQAIVKAKTETASTGVKDPEKEVEKQATGPLTSEILEPEDIDDAEKEVVKATGENPSKKDITEELDSAAKNYFESNKSSILKKIVKRVEDFNSMSDKDRNSQKGEFEYILNSDNKLDIPTEKTVENLYKNLLQVAGKIVPYHNLHHGNTSVMLNLAIQVMFEIYAIKKTDTGDLSVKDIDTLVEVIKRKEEE